jgi:hypothetical protein
MTSSYRPADGYHVERSGLFVGKRGACKSTLPLGRARLAVGALDALGGLAWLRA